MSGASAGTLNDRRVARQLSKEARRQAKAARRSAKRARSQGKARLRVAVEQRP